MNRPALTHLQALETETIHIMREVVAECESPVMLYSIGKDNAVMVHIAMKAFYPAPFSADHERMPLALGQRPFMKKVRFRYPLTGAIESEADTLPAIIQEMPLTTTSERQGGVIDHDASGSMEKKKREGCF